MPEPSREAREAAEAVELSGEMDRDWAANRRVIARALDDFAGKRVDDVARRAIDVANALIAAEQERDALRRRVAELEAVQDAFDDTHDTDAFAVAHWKARAEAAESALDEIAELDPEELGENDDEWGGAAVGARAQEIAEEARRGRGDG